MAKALPRDLWYGFIIFTLIIVGGVSLMGEFNSYDSNYLQGDASGSNFEQFNNSFNQLDEVTDQTNAIKETFQPEDDKPISALGALNALVLGSWNVLVGMFGSITFMTNALTGLTNSFGVPAWIMGIIGLLIIILISFSIWSAVFQREI